MRGGTLRVAAQVVALALTLVSAPFIIRELGEGGFGRYSLVVAVVTIVAGVSELGLSSVGVREWVHLDRAGRRELLADLLGVRLLVSATAAIFALLFAVAIGYPDEVVFGIAIALVGVTLNAVQAALAIPLVAALRNGMVGLIELARIALQVVLQLALVLVGTGVLPLLVAMIPAGLVGVLLVAAAVRRDLVRPRVNPARIRVLLRESAVFALATAVSVVYLRTTVLIAPKLMDEDTFGQFTIGFRAVESLTVVPMMLTAALFPVLAHAAVHDRVRLARGYGLMWRSATVLGAVTACGVAGAAPLGVLVLGGGDSAVATDTLVLLGCALGAIFVGAAAMWMLLAEHAYRAVLRINILALAANIALTIGAVELLGPRWTAAGILVCEVGIALAADQAVRRGLDTGESAARREQVLQLFRVVAATTIGLGVFALTRDSFVLVPLVTAPFACLAVLLVSRAVPAPLWAMMRQITAGTLTRRDVPGVSP